MKSATHRTRHDGDIEIHEAEWYMEDVSLVPEEGKPYLHR
jgi:hypothetical protein